MALPFGSAPLAFHDFAVGRRSVRRLRAVGLGLGRPVLDAAVEQRIALEFRFDVSDQIEIRELQQLDRLHQLRRHHQRLALADLESLRKRH